MQNTIDISRLSIEEKLRVMEDIWEDLSRENKVESPKWHKEVLQETEQRLHSGEEKIVDWEDAKKDLWNYFNKNEI